MVLSRPNPPQTFPLLTVASRYVFGLDAVNCPLNLTITIASLRPKVNKTYKILIVFAPLVSDKQLLYAFRLQRGTDWLLSSLHTAWGTMLGNTSANAFPSYIDAPFEEPESCIREIPNLDLSPDHADLMFPTTITQSPPSGSRLRAALSAHTAHSLAPLNSRVYVRRITVIPSARAIAEV